MLLVDVLLHPDAPGEIIAALSTSECGITRFHIACVCVHVRSRRLISPAVRQHLAPYRGAVMKEALMCMQIMNEREWALHIKASAALLDQHAANGA